MVRVADFIADFLYKNGIHDIFMISGGGAIHLDDAVARHHGIREICIKNEATGPMMAKAYAQITNNFGVVYVTTGPGGANAVTGVVECFVDSSPVMIISGQVPLNQTTYNAKIPGLRSFGVQELNIVNIVKSVTKYATMITKPETILYELQKAFHIMKDGRPGPVWIDVPLDIQSAIIDETSLLQYEPPQKLDMVLDFLLWHHHVETLVSVLKTAKRPLIVAGQGIRGAVTELKEVAELINAPIILSRMGLDTLPFSYRHNMGIGGIKGTKYNKRIMREADVILSVGTSLSVAFAGHNLSFFDKDADVYMVDIETIELQKFTVRPPHFIQSDAKRFLGLLRDKLQKNWSEDVCEWMDSCIALKEKYNAASLAPERNPIDIYYLTKMVDEMSTENDIFVDDAGSIYYVASQTLTFNLEGQREVTSGAFASMGNTIPLAVGCAIANPNARILAMTGDGSLETNVQELKTLSYYNLNVKLFVINNGGYISMRDHGRHIADERSAMSNLRKVAEAFDVPYYLISDYTQLEWAKNTVNFQDGPIFFEVICDDNQKLITPD